MPELSVAEIAALVEGDLIGDGDRSIRGVAPLEAAGPTDLSLVASARYLPYLTGSRAAAVLVSAQVTAETERAQIRVDDPHAALIRILPLLYPAEEPPQGIHPTAVVEEDVELGSRVSVGPYAVLGAGTRVGNDTVIGAHVVVGKGCRIGAGCVVHPHVTLYPGVRLGDRCIVHSGVRLGADGFGYAWVGGEHRKIPQVGGCRVGHDVEIGANSTVDRGSIGDTVIGTGTKIDNLVHVGHNARLGEKVIVVAQVGISGSTTIGDGAVLGGQAGFQGHISVGAGARIGAQAGVISDVPAGQTVSGYPARPHGEAMRAQAALLRLPSLLRRVREIEDKLRREEQQDSR